MRRSAKLACMPSNRGRKSCSTTRIPVAPRSTNVSVHVGVHMGARAHVRPLAQATMGGVMRAVARRFHCAVRGVVYPRECLRASRCACGRARVAVHNAAHVDARTWCALSMPLRPRPRAAPPAGLCAAAPFSPLLPRHRAPVHTPLTIFYRHRTFGAPSSRTSVRIYLIRCLYTCLCTRLPATLRR